MIDSSIEQELRENGAYISTTVGYSMWPMLRDRRDTVIIRAVEGELRRGDVALYKLPNGQYVLHRVLQSEGDNYRIAGDNCGVLETVPKAAVLGVLDGFYRGEKWIAPDNRGYAFYRGVTCTISPVRRWWVRARTRLLRAGSRCKRAIFRKKSEEK